MSPDAIAALLAPYLGDERLSATQLAQFATYLDLLLRWNARTNLTAVREPEDIVSRHFGESLFAARHLLPTTNDHRPTTAADLGSGAGFPGLPLKIWAPSLRITLIESQNKKATFLREVIRALQLKEAEVFAGRAEDLMHQHPQIANHKSQITNGFDLVTLRAVERFESALQAAFQLVSPGGRLALLIGESQAETARNHARQLQWSEPLSIPLSSARILLVGRDPSQQEPAQ
jgi:16S rRNA (guanine527-N7)-methyltransferase